MLEVKRSYNHDSTRFLGYFLLRFFSFLLFFFSFLIPYTAYADGISWLETQVNADGSYANTIDVSFPAQSTAEVLRTYHLLSEELQPGVIDARAFIGMQGDEKTEILSRKIIALVEAGWDATALVAKLLLLQNKDGGFGDQKGYQSRVIDTAFALNALGIAQSSGGSDAIGNAVSYLLREQSSDGGFSHSSVNNSSVYETALASIALQNFRFNFNLTAAIDGASNYLTTNQQAAGGWGSVWETAYALLALIPVTSDVQTYQGAVDGLKTAQGADGSWNQDVYETALALRALYTAQNTIPSESGKATVAGLIRDNQSNTVISGAIVTVTTQSQNVYSATTDSDGKYVIKNIPPGEVTLSVSADNYSTISATGILVASQILTYSPGMIAHPQPQTITLTGVVVDAVTSEPLSDATVQVINSSYSTTSDISGNFQISNIPAGNLTIEIKRAGYISMLYTASIPAGGNLSLGVLELQHGVLSGTTGIVSGLVTDAITKDPLRGVQVTVSGKTNKTTFTGQDGSFRLENILEGDITLSAKLDGYLIASASSKVLGGGNLKFNVALVKDTNPALVTLQGNVIEKGTSTALSNVTVTINDSTKIFTNNDGKFYVAGISPGVLSVVFTLNGYNTVTYNLTTNEGDNLNLNEIQLAPDIPVSGNKPPVIHSNAPTLAAVGERYQYQIKADDPENETLIYGLSNYPSGMKIDSVTGVIQWIPTVKQKGIQNFIIEVSDSSGAVTEQSASVNVNESGTSIYVVTDVMTLNQLTIDKLVPSNYVPGSYVSGGRSGTWRATSNNGCGFSYVSGGASASSIQTAANSLDFYSMGSGYGNDAIWDMGTARSSVTVLPLIDHGPFPQEGIEYTIWGSNDPNAPFPEGWKLATLVTIYGQGWSDNRSLCSQMINIDDYAGLYTFGKEDFRYVRLKADNSISIFDTPEHTTYQSSGDDSGLPGWQSVESEIDGVVGMVCDVKPIANAGADIEGLTGDNIRFDATSSQGNIINYGWDLDGDNEIDLNGVEAAYNFTASFDGDVTLYVTDNNGCVDSDTVHVSIGLDFPKPDLVVKDIDGNAINTNVNTLEVTGTVGVTVENIGSAPSIQAATISLFEDINKNNKLDINEDNIFGTQTMPSGLGKQQTQKVNIAINGKTTFRDAPILAFVDSLLNIDEEIESNNIGRSKTCLIPKGSGIQQYFGYTPGANESVNMSGSNRLTLVGYEDGTNYTIKKLPDLSIIYEGTINQLQKKIIYPGRIHFVIESNNKLLAVLSQSSFGNYTETGNFFYPALDTNSFYGKEFIILKLGKTYKPEWSRTVVFAKDAGTVVIKDTSGAIVASSPYLSAGDYWKTPTLKHDTVYTVHSTNIIAIQQFSANSVSSIPPSKESVLDAEIHDDIGTEFYFTADSSIAVMNPFDQPAIIRVEKMMSGDILIRDQLINPGEIYYSGILPRDGYYRLIATQGRVGLWSGSTEGGDAVEHMGDDLISSLGYEGKRFIINTQTSGGVLFAGEDNTDIKINNKISFSLNKNGIYHLDPYQNLFIESSKPVTEPLALCVKLLKHKD